MTQPTTKCAPLVSSDRSSDEPCLLCGHPWIHHTVPIPGETFEIIPGARVPCLRAAPCDWWGDGEICCDDAPECDCPGKCGCVCFVSSEEAEEARIGGTDAH